MTLPGRLPCASHPRPDELLSSWLTRLAHDHLMKTYTFGKLLFPTSSLWNRNLDMAAPELVLQTLAGRTTTPLARIRETALRRYEGRLYLQHHANTSTKWILPLGVYHRTHRHCGLLFCPSCLKADGDTPYFRTHWRLALAQVCTRCGVYLHDRCPACTQPVTFFRVELGRKSALPDTPISHCFRCGLDLATVPAECAPAVVCGEQAEWERILREGWNQQAFYPHQYFDVLHRLARTLISARPVSTALQRAVDALTGWSPVEECPAVRTRRLPFELLPLRARGGVVRQAQWLLTEWPTRFVRVAKQNQVSSTPLLADMPEVPFWYHRVVWEHLHMNNKNRRFGDFWR
ncbi:TniQ family protein [Hymenobacter coccineus]|uniref:TniQ domain-containing protein n=1 Tax=Hymenobacter coccineus TaxID=1908235 RepID=A0A1G1TKU9_9BACT|nr:TniQ family protein [Hymenobacter coccineus]OGX91498.1 hypothetical protein BEN49_04815 [Hymenobacter coccineus]